MPAVGCKADMVDINVVVLEAEKLAIIFKFGRDCLTLSAERPSDRGGMVSTRERNSIMGWSVVSSYDEWLKVC
jgi:hypothetical protein